MTGHEAVKKAAEMLGYTAANGNINLSARLAAKQLTLLNLVYSDLWRVCETGEFVPLKLLQDEIQLPERALNDCFLYGLAAFMAQSESDGDQQQIYILLYNRKRTGLSRRESIVDVLPRSVDL